MSTIQINTCLVRWTKTASLHQLKLLPKNCNLRAMRCTSVKFQVSKPKAGIVRRRSVTTQVFFLISSYDGRPLSAWPD